MSAPARPGSRYEAELLRVKCEQDGDEHPLEWSEPHTPAGAPGAGPDARRDPKAGLKALSGRAARFLTLRRAK